MSKSKGLGRGGKRAGAGRKPRPKPTRQPLVIPASGTLQDVRELARTHTALAIAALAQIAEHGESEAAAVSAAKALIGIGHGGASEGALAPIGKKAQRQEAAKKIGGIFATPPTPPRLVINEEH